MPKTEKDRRNIIEQLEQLAFRVNSEVSKGLERQWIQPREAVSRLRRVKKFHYTNQGIKAYEFDWEYHARPSWDQASKRVMDAVKKSEEYILAKRLQVSRKRKDNLTYLDSFIRHLVSYRLYQERLDSVDIHRFISTFVRDLEKQPVNCRVKAALEGIVLQPEEIRLRINGIPLILRKTKPEDLEYASSSFESLLKSKRIPTAIVEFELPSRNADDIREKVEQVVAILRLFKGSCVQCHSYHTASDSITEGEMAGAFYSKPSHRPLSQTLVRNADIEKLRKFWQRINKVLPSSFYSSKPEETGPIYIAYNRYSTALLQEGIFERRVTNALMGLESLYLRSQESDDLVYRLSLRAAKVLDFLGADPYRAKQMIEDAYYVKNIFAHGELLLLREKRKLIKKYHKEGFLETILNYLRISIIIMLVTFHEKDVFLELIDGALIDRAKDAQLDNLLNSSRKFL